MKFLIFIAGALAGAHATAYFLGSEIDRLAKEVEDLSWDRLFWAPIRDSQ